MYNPHQEILEHFQTLNTKIERLELIIQTQKSIPEPKAEEDILYTPKQLAKLWNCTVQTIHNKKDSGELQFMKKGRIIRFSKKAIEESLSVK